MKIETESYLQSLDNLPKQGQRIVAHQKDDCLVVYQAYNHQIADFALKNQCFGGSHYSYNRMSWIKPNFLWMMYRCGWAQKENQERVLAIWIRKIDFEHILAQAVFSSYKEEHYSSQEEWRGKLNKQEVRLQWDPDHDPYGDKLTRRAIQLGLKGKTLETFGKDQVLQIEDITSFVAEQRNHVLAKDLYQLQVPVERVYTLSSEEIRKSVGAD